MRDHPPTVDHEPSFQQNGNGVHNGDPHFLTVFSLNSVVEYEILQYILKSFK